MSLYLYFRKPSYDEFGVARVTSITYDRNQGIINDEDKDIKDIVSGGFSLKTFQTDKASLAFYEANVKNIEMKVLNWNPFK